jgi:hypothetical protein
MIAVSAFEVRPTLDQLNELGAIKTKDCVKLPIRKKCLVIGRFAQAAGKNIEFVKSERFGGHQTSG